MSHYMQMYKNNKQSIMDIDNASNSSKSSIDELTRRQHKRKKTVKETKKTRNLRDTTIESFVDKKRERRTLFEESQGKRRSGILPKETWNETTTTSTTYGKSTTTVTRTVVTMFSRNRK
eukprot:838858-Ditylum_brightwellii.AAC.1